MRLSDYDQHKMDEAYSAHMDSEERERTNKAERERINAAAAAYVDNMLAHTSDPAFAAKLLIADRAFLLSCMAGFACEEVTLALGKLA